MNGESIGDFTKKACVKILYLPIMKSARKRCTNFSVNFFAPREKLWNIPDGMLLHLISALGDPIPFIRLTASVTMAVTFGYEYPPGKEDDHFISLAEETMDGLSSTFQPGSTLINVFPFLKYIPPWVPGATTQKFAARIRSVAHLYRNEPFESVERQMVSVPISFSYPGVKERHRLPESR